MLATRRTRRLGVAVGSVSVAVGVALGGLFLGLVAEGPLGSLRPFTALTTHRVSPATAMTWTYLDAMWVHPTVTWDNVTVVRSVLDVLDGDTDRFVVLRLVPPTLLVAAGALTAWLAGRRAGPRSVTPLVGATIALGYTPLVVAVAWLTRVPVAPAASGRVVVGNTITTAADVAGVAAGPPLFPTVVVALVYPVVFGLLGGVLSQQLVALADWLRRAYPPG
ncbi:hypothetical protein [Salinigranum salinum]|uniref:hypothetical protein n=1 Tax=Salinigranum salinum TaxID=1364937 RepID=UPI0012604B32|nr:hypothetical protein [Salinigranum salinum]